MLFMLSASGIPVPGEVKARNLNAISSACAPSRLFVCEPRPFLFARKFGSGYDLALPSIWTGGFRRLSHFVYDESTHEYLRYCGRNERPNGPFSTLRLWMTRRRNRRQPAFANIIIQRVPYEHDPVFTLILNELVLAMAMRTSS